MSKWFKYTCAILLLGYANFSFCQDFTFKGSGNSTSPADGEDVSLWYDENNFTYISDISDLSADGLIIDLNGQWVDFAGVTLGNSSLVNYNSASTAAITIGANGVLYFSGLKPPNLVLASSTPSGNTGYLENQLLLNTSSSIEYNRSGNQEIMSLSYYNNIIFNNSGTKTSVAAATGGLVINGSLIDKSSSGITISCKNGIEFGTNCSLSVKNGTKFLFDFRPKDYTSPTPRYFVNDLRTSKSYPGTWIHKQDFVNGVSDTVLVVSGTYYGIEVASSTKLSADIDVTNSFSFNSIKTVSNPHRFLNLNGKTLTLRCAVTYPRNGYLQGSRLSNIICTGSSANGTLCFDSTSTGRRTVKNFSISNNAEITLGNWLNIAPGVNYGIVDVSSNSKLYTRGYLTLKSDEYGTAMISSSSGTIAHSSGNNIGTLLVENYIPYLNRGRQYRFLSSPVIDGVFLQWRDSLNSRTGRGTHITGKTTGSATNDFDESTTNHPSGFEYDETKAGNVTGVGTNSGAAEDAGWVRLSQANSKTIENGKGYRMLIRGDRTIDLTSSGSNFSPNNTTLQTRGGYVAGPTDVTITNSGSNANNGINLIGNPYACAIDWNEIYTTCSTTTGSTNVDPVYAVFDPSMQSYQSYSANALTPGPMQYISPGQGFLVYTSSSSQKVLFPTSCKVTSDAGARVFSTIKTNHLVTYLRKDSATADRTIIYFIPGATNFYDKYDAGHIQNGKVNLSSVDSSNILYNINCLDSLTSSRIVNLSLYGTPTGTYTMAFEDINTFRNHDVYLIDNYLKKTTKIDDMTQYHVEVNADKFSYAEGRLSVSFEPKPVTSVVTVNKTDIFNISPNPVKDQLIINMDDETIGTIEYEIFNVSGQSMLNGSLDSSESKINTSKLMTGIYFINLRANNQTQTIKFIK